MEILGVRGAFRRYPDESQKVSYMNPREWVITGFQMLLAVAGMCLVADGVERDECGKAGSRSEG